MNVECTHAPSPAGVLGSSAKGDADGGHALGADAGAAAHQLVDVDPHLAVVRALPVTPTGTNVSITSHQYELQM